MKPHGYGGRLLRVDLSTGEMEEEPIENYLDWVGGRGINAWILFNELPVEAEPLSPENILAIGAGSLVGTLAPFCSRVSIDTKNAFTGGVGSANCGGHFGAEMKYAGYDNIVFKGRSPTPVYLWLNDGEAELRDASELWGKTTWETERLIREREKDEGVRVLAIGPAGENQVRSACIMSDRAKAAGGSGVWCAERIPSGARPPPPRRIQGIPARGSLESCSKNSKRAYPVTCWHPHPTPLPQKEP